MVPIILDLQVNYAILSQGLTICLYTNHYFHRNRIYFDANSKIFRPN
jgi:hypothetical protein